MLIIYKVLFYNFTYYFVQVPNDIDTYVKDFSDNIDGHNIDAFWRGTVFCHRWEFLLPVEILFQSFSVFNYALASIKIVSCSVGKQEYANSHVKPDNP